MDEDEIKQLREGLISGVKDAMKERDKEVTVVLQKAQADIEAFGKVQEGTKAAVAELNTKGQELHNRLAVIEQTVAEVKARPAGGPTREKSIGERFVESGIVQDFAKEVGGAGRGRSKSFHCKAITSLDNSAGAGVQVDRLPGVVQEPLRPLTVRDLIDVSSTESNAVEWVRELLFTNAAAPVAEGAEKPESDITFELQTAGVKTIAHWIHASRQILSDFKQLQSIINGRLSYGLKIKEEDQLLLGDGTGQNLHGLIPQATAYNTALNRPSDTMIDILRHAILQVRLAFYPASGIVLSPTDWHTIELMKDNENRYLLTSPSGRAPAMLWGLPVAESDAMPNGDFMVGAFRLAATVFDRELASIMVSTEDRDNFIKNMVTILCEERLLLAVIRPASFVHGGWPQGLSTG